MNTAGCTTVELFDERMGLSFPMVVMYPSSAPEQPVAMGPYELNVAVDGPVEAHDSPLVLISHGNGGSHLGYRALTAHLARHGFVVAMPEHPRNNRNNNELVGTAENLANRPRHLRLALDWMLSSDRFASRLKPCAIAIVGHSLGGYTALAAAGGVPTAFPNETKDGQSAPIEVQPDERVQALVLLAPATAWYMAPDALRGVRLPILLWTAGQESITPAFHGDLVKSGVGYRDLVEHRIVEDGGHFAFLTPFPEAMRSPTFPPSQDPPGFDRPQFQEELSAGVLEFLTRVFSASTDLKSADRAAPLHPSANSERQ